MGFPTFPYEISYNASSGAEAAVLKAAPLSPDQVERAMSAVRRAAEEQRGRGILRRAMPQGFAALSCPWLCCANGYRTIAFTASSPLPPLLLSPLPQPSPAIIIAMAIKLPLPLPLTLPLPLLSL